jgi:hypothetical protein
MAFSSEDWTAYVRLGLIDMTQVARDNWTANLSGRRLTIAIA